MSLDERIANLKINLESQKGNMEYYVKHILEQNTVSTSTEMVNKFMEELNVQIKQHEKEDMTDLARFYRLIMSVRPALDTILKPGNLYDSILDVMITNFNVILDRLRRTINDPKEMRKNKGPILPGSNKTFELRYFCTNCNQSFPIPPEMKEKIEIEAEKVELPLHCEKEMNIKIFRIEDETKEEVLEKINIYPAEVLLGHIDSSETNAEYLDLLSVGIDVGSSTSHLVFSKLTLKRETSVFNMTNRFNLINREIIHEGNIIFTPLLDKVTIDIEK